MRVNEQPAGLPPYLTRLWRELALQLNLLSEGYAQATTNAATAAPTAGDFSVGDFVRNSAPGELGAAGSKYIVCGWTCITAGSPGTWVETRALTGN